eukprot:Platyproteum_vivax@DN15351_c0_g1_i1.p1
MDAAKDKKRSRLLGQGGGDDDQEEDEDEEDESLSKQLLLPSSSSRQEEQDQEQEKEKIKRNSKKQQQLNPAEQRLFDLRLRLNQGRRLNSKAIVEENKTYLDKTYAERSAKWKEAEMMGTEKE